MKKIAIFLVIIGISFCFYLISNPVKATSTSSATSSNVTIQTLLDQINQLKAQIQELQSKTEALKEAKKEVQETVKEIKTTLRITKQLRLGMTDEEVKMLQEILATDPSIYPEGLITGYYGRLTEQAVRRLQKSLCLDQVGNVGPQTLVKVNELLTEGAGKSGKIPPGLLTAPGIRKKLCFPPATSTTPGTSTTPEQGCLNSGGQVATSSCCLSTSNFPNLCLIGACGCDATNSHEINTCNCETSKCFNGSKCVGIE